MAGKDIGVKKYVVRLLKGTHPVAAALQIT
jgi:hypothetical protein